jgi:hypothetical protein
MPKFTFTSPEGKTYDIEGPEGATKEQAFGILQQRIGGTNMPKPADAVPPKQPDQNMTAFVGGNLSKGVADVAGLPVDLANSAIEGVKGLANLGGAHLKANDSPVGGSEWIKQQLSKIGSIGPSAEPRTPTQQVVAKGLEAAPSAVIPGGGGLLSRTGAAVGGGVGGEVGRQLGGTAGQVAGSLLGGGVGGMAGAERPSAIPKPPSEAARASQASGIPLTIGQETGNKVVTGTENMLRDFFTSAGTAHKDALAQAEKGAASVNRLADQVQNATGNPEVIGNRLREAYTNTVENLATARAKQATTDYNAAEQIAGNTPVINYKNTVDTLKKIVAENKNVPSGDSAKVAKQAQAILDQLTEQGAATVSDAIKTRSAWGNAARRTGNIFTDIDPNANQMLAKRLFGAVNKDFEDASTAATPIAQALRKANQNYSKASQSIEYVEKSALGKLLGEDVVDAMKSGQTANTKAPEMIAKRYLTAEPSQARAITNILKRNAPDVLQETKAFVLKNGLEQAKSDAPGATAISFAKFRKEIDKVAPKMREMGFTDKEIKDIKDITDTMARAGDKTGVNTSKTTSTAQATGVLSLAASGHVIPAAIAAGGPLLMSKALLTEKGRSLLRAAMDSSNTKAQQAAIGALRGLIPAASPPSGAPASATGTQLPSPPQ